MVAYKVKMLDGSWYTLGSTSGAVAKIRRTDGTWTADSGSGLLAKVRKLDGTMGTGVPFGDGLPSEPWVEVEQCGDEWCYIYRPIFFPGANDGSTYAQWFFNWPLPEEYNGGGLCQSSPGVWYTGGDIAHVVNNGQSLSSGINGRSDASWGWLRWQLGGPPAGYTGAYLRYSLALDPGNCHPLDNWTKAVRLTLETGDNIGTPNAYYGYVAGTANTITDGRGIVTKEALVSDFYLSTWFDNAHSYWGQPVSYLSTTTTGSYIAHRTHVSQVALVFKYESNPLA